MGRLIVMLTLLIVCPLAYSTEGEQRTTIHYFGALSGCDELLREITNKSFPHLTGDLVFSRLSELDGFLISGNEKPESEPLYLLNLSKQVVMPSDNLIDFGFQKSHLSEYLAQYLKKSNVYVFSEKEQTEKVIKIVPLHSAFLSRQRKKGGAPDVLETKT